MKIHRTFGRALPALVAAAMAGVAGGALAQSPPPAAPQTTPQGDTRDLLGRARSTNEGQMVEDLIKRLQGPAQGGAPGQTVPPQTTVGPTPTSPAAPAAPGTTPGTSVPSRVATPPPGAPPVPPAATARTPVMPPAGPQAAPSGGVSVGVSPAPRRPLPALTVAAPQPTAPPTQQRHSRDGCRAPPLRRRRQPRMCPPHRPRPLPYRSRVQALLSARVRVPARRCRRRCRIPSPRRRPPSRRQRPAPASVVRRRVAPPASRLVPRRPRVRRASPGSCR